MVATLMILHHISIVLLLKLVPLLTLMLSQLLYLHKLSQTYNSVGRLVNLPSLFTFEIYYKYEFLSSAG